MRWLSVMLTLTVVGGCGAAKEKPASTSQSKEAVYAGKTLVELIALTKDKDQQVRKAAAEALEGIKKEKR